MTSFPPYEPLEIEIEATQKKENIVALLKATIVGVEKSGNQDTLFSLKLEVKEKKEASE